jgi:hypothetical protein
MWHCVTTADTSDKCFESLKAYILSERGKGELAVLKGGDNADPDERTGSRISSYRDGPIGGRRLGVGS